MAFVVRWRTAPAKHGARAPEATAAAARRALENDYPDLEVTDVWLRASESDRDVVAVLHRDRGADPNIVPRGCPRYKLFAVRHDLTSEELPRAGESPYLIRGIK
jgi:hypothetical protein